MQVRPDFFADECWDGKKPCGRSIQALTNRFDLYSCKRKMAGDASANGRRCKRKMAGFQEHGSALCGAGENERQEKVKDKRK